MKCSFAFIIILEKCLVVSSIDVYSVFWSCSSIDEVKPSHFTLLQLVKGSRSASVWCGLNMFACIV